MLQSLHSLLAALTRATSQLRALRYAWGIVGLSAASAIALRFQGNGKAAIIAGGLALVAFVLVAVAATAVGSGRVLVAPATTLVWAVTGFLIIFLGFTVTAFAAGMPCNWASFLEVPSNPKWCRHLAPDKAVFDLKRIVDFSAMRCENGKKVDPVVFTDVVTFREGPLPRLFSRPFNIPKDAQVTVTDIETGEKLGPPSKVGGAEKFGAVTFVVNPATRQARFQWSYVGAHLGDEEGVGFAPAEPYVLGTVDAIYKFAGDPQLRQRTFQPVQLESLCTRSSHGFTCKDLNTDKPFRELWHWAVWGGCPHT